MNKSTDSDDFGWEPKPSEHEVSNRWANDKLNNGSDGKAPFLNDRLEVGARKHESDTNDREWRSSTADIAYRVGNKTGEL